MPTYVYRCEQCGHRFEAWQHMTDDPLATCPQCQGHIHRVLFPASIVFKGSGFYSTDHRPNGVAAEPVAAIEKPTTEKSAGEKSESTAGSTPPPAAAPTTPAPSNGTDSKATTTTKS